MKIHKRNQEKKNLKFAIIGAIQENQERTFEDYFEQLPYRGCHCSSCVSLRRYDQSIRSHIVNLNKPSSQTLGEIIISKIFK